MLYDYIIIGGGIIGLSTAWQLQQREPDKKILLLEKEGGFAEHQTGRNSGVIHAGIYYTLGSMKARFCKAGVEATVNFCRQNAIEFEQCGKLLVATDALEMERMHALYERAQNNGLDVKLLDTAELKTKEPNVSGLGAIFSRKSGIVDYPSMCKKMAKKFRAMGGETRLNSKVVYLNEDADKVNIHTNSDKLTARFLISCTGLMADRMAKILGIKTDFQIIPIRGEYYQLPAEKNNLVNHLIYPIPDPGRPFLGIHLTKMIDGSITVGPNAVQGWKREGYGKVNLSLGDIAEMFSFPGFWKMAVTNLKAGIIETRNSFCKSAYLKQVQKYCPSIQYSDLKPYPAGIRAQAVLRDGTLVDDFLFARSLRSLHVCNAPSPAATSAIPIGNYICDKVSAELRV